MAPVTDIDLPHRAQREKLSLRENHKIFATDPHGLTQTKKRFSLQWRKDAEKNRNTRSDSGHATAAVTVDNPLTLQITAPTAQQIIRRPDVLVRGTFWRRDGLETGIQVNGVTALGFAQK